MKAFDNIGQEINVGDIIAYATTIDRSANQGVYEVVDIVKKEERSWGHSETVVKLKARLLRKSYSYNHKDRPVTLSMLERCIVLPKHYKGLIEQEDNP